MINNSSDFDKQYENRRFIQNPFYKFSPKIFFFLFGFLVAGLLIWAEVDYGFLEALWKNIAG